MSYFLTSAGKKMFAKHIQQYTPQDPLYEYYTDKRGNKKRRRREIPPGLSKRDIKILKSVQTRAHYLDKGFKVGPVRFGWTFIIGLVPGVGDAADAILNYVFVVRKARQADLPPWLLSQMFLNNLISAGVGLVPFVGDVILASFKANSRNAALLEEFLRIRGEELLKAQAAGTSANPANVEQVKPGAGKASGEVIPNNVLPQTGTTAGTSSLAAPSVLPPSSSNTSPGSATSTGANANQSGGTSSGKLSGKSRLSFSGWRNKSGDKGKGTAAASNQVGERGRFIEDVGSK